MSATTAKDTVSSVGVVGAGQMGSGIAQVFAAAGIPAYLWDARQEAVSRGISATASQLKKLVEKGKLPESDVERIMSNIHPAGSLEQCARTSLVIEAIVENLDHKIALFKQCDTFAGPETIFASNTSSISITKMAAATSRPERFMGVHFMNPVPVMKLVELIRGLQTSDQTYATVVSTMERIGKTTVLALDGPGFIVNRILVPMVNEAIYLLQEGVKPTDIDTAMKLGTNQPMGPLELADFVGLDTLLYILQVLHKELGEDKYRPCPLLVKYVEAGWFGRKNGRGFYSYAAR